MNNEPTFNDRTIETQITEEFAHQWTDVEDLADIRQCVEEAATEAERNFNCVVGFRRSKYGYKIVVVYPRDALRKEMERVPQFILHYIDNVCEP